MRSWVFAGKENGWELRYNKSMRSWVFAGKENGWVRIEDVELVSIKDTPRGTLYKFYYNYKRYTSEMVYGEQPKAV